MKRLYRKTVSLFISILLAVCCSVTMLPFTTSAEKYDPATDFMAGKYGIFLHYLSTLQCGSGCSLEQWNNTVNSFDVDGFAQQASDAGASWVCITLTQADGLFCIPMPELEEMIGGTKTSTDRDLVLDLSNALTAKGIKLMLYWGPGVPSSNNSMAKNLGAVRRVGSELAGGQSGADWMLNWTVVKNMSSLMSVVSKRYGDKISGWWFDGCYDSIDFNQRVSEKEAAALKSGNPKALIAYNNGTKYNDCRFAEESYTAGETCHPNTLSTNNFLNYSSDKRWTDSGYQRHFLTFLGSNWGQSGLVYGTDELVKHCYDNILKNGAAITFDMQVSGDGILNNDQLGQLKALKSYAQSQPAPTYKSAQEAAAEHKDTAASDDDEKQDTSSEQTKQEAEVQTQSASENTWMFIAAIVFEGVVGCTVIVIIVLIIRKRTKKGSGRKGKENE